MVSSRAAMFTRVNGTISCFCNERLQNWPTVYTNLSMWPAWQRHGLLLNSISLWKSLKKWYVTSRSGSSIRLFVFSDLAVFDKVSTAIRNYGGHAQWNIKMSRILSHSTTAWNNYIPAFLTVILRGDAYEFFVYFLLACVLMRTSTLKSWQLCLVCVHLLITRLELKKITVMYKSAHEAITFVIT